MTDRELMQQALEALEEIADEVFSPYGNKLGETIIALRDRLAQTEQEPSIRWDASAPVLLNGGRITQYPNGDIGVGTPAPRQWQGLTDKEIVAIELNPRQYYDGKSLRFDLSLADFARAIEAKLKEKNT